MFSPILLSLAMAGTSAPVEQIIIIDDRPSIRIPLRDYDLGRSDDLRKLRFEIGRASRKVCDHGYRDTVDLAHGTSSSEDTRVRRPRTRFDG